MTNEGLMSPVKTVKVFIGKTEVSLKLSFYAQIELDEQGIDLGRIWQILNTKPGNLVAYFKVFAALAAFSYVEKGQPVPTPQDWKIAVNASPDPLGDWKNLIAAVGEVLFVKKQEPSAQPMTEETVAGPEKVQ